MTRSGIAGEPAVFPWGSNNPTRQQRLIVAALISAAVCARFYWTHRSGDIHSDFSPLRFAAQALLEGRNPYELIGPGNVFESRLPIIYPATAFVFAAPFLPFQEPWASLLFIAISCSLLAYGSTRDSWHRLPMFASLAFISSAHFAQLSILATAALFIPALSFVAAVKPQAGIPVVAAATSRAAMISAIAGGIVLLGASLAIFPTWPLEWIENLRTTEQVRAPVTRLGGIFILAVLLRWRRPEAWLVFVMAVLPQTWYAYNALPLLTIGRNFREAGLLAVSSSAGSLFTALLTNDLYASETMRMGGAMLVATAYLPAVAIILSRPNTGPSPAWLRALTFSRGSRNW